MRTCLNGCGKEIGYYKYFCSIDCEVKHTNGLNNKSKSLKQLTIEFTLCIGGKKNANNQQTCSRSY